MSRSAQILARVRSGLVVASVAVFLSVAPVGCGPEEEPPVTAARAYASAAQRADIKTMLTLVDADAVAALQSAANRASDQVGGRRNIEPHEMLQVVALDHRFQVAKAELVDANEHTAHVKLIGADGREHTLELLNEQGQWRVKLTPPQTAAKPVESSSTRPSPNSAVPEAPPADDAAKSPDPLTPELPAPVEPQP